MSGLTYEEYRGVVKTNITTQIERYDQLLASGTIGREEYERLTSSIKSNKIFELTRNYYDFCVFLRDGR